MKRASNTPQGDDRPSSLERWLTAHEAGQVEALWRSKVRSRGVKVTPASTAAAKTSFPTRDRRQVSESVIPPEEPPAATDESAGTDAVSPQTCQPPITARSNRWRWGAIALVAVLGMGSIGAATLWKRGAAVLRPHNLDRDCAEMVHQDAILNPEAAEQLPSVLGQERATATQKLGQPYCRLGKLAVRAGAIVERDVYRLDRDRRAIVAYEEGVAIGYGFDPPVDRSGEQSDRKEIDLKQNWGISIGETVAGRPVVGGLGSLSLAARGRIYAPADGISYTETHYIANGEIVPAPANCLAFASPQLPAYLLQLCGVKERHRGEIQRGRVLGTTDDHLHVALLRHNGKQWMFVPPAPELFDRLLQQS